MAKTSKKALGATMAGVMAVGAIAGAVHSVDQVKVANAATSKAQNDAKAKISHLTWSLKNNYLGLKNQGQWEQYIKEAKALIAKMPTAEKTVADALTAEVNRDQELVNGLARINQVEKSYETNFKGIKNASTWRTYLDLATTSLKSVDQKEFANQYAELVSRLNVASDNVKKIEDAYKVELDAATKLYNDAKASMNLDDAKKALAAAEALGTHATSDALEASCKTLISQIENLDVTVKTVSIDAKTFDDDTKDQRLSLKINGEAMNIDFLKGAGYDVKFAVTKGDSTKLLADDTTGKLVATPEIGDYKVQVTVSKAGNIVVSDEAEVKVANLDSTASSISSMELLNGTFNQASGTLVAGESLNLQSIKITNGTQTSKVTDNISIKSSDETVLSVKDNKVTAIGLGTAKLTVSYGKITKEVTYNVVGTARKLTKLTADSSSVNVVTDSTNNKIKVKAVDQYGDPFIIDDGTSPTADTKDNVTVEKTGNLSTPTISNVINTVDSTDKTDQRNGLNEIKFNAGSSEETAVIYVKDYDGKSIAQYSVKTVKNAGVVSTKLELVKVDNNDDYSDDANLMINTATGGTEDTMAKLALNEYTTSGVKTGKADLTGATVTFDSKLITVEDGTATVTSGTAIATTGVKELEIGIAADAKAGNTNLVVNQGGKIYTINITVFDENDVKINSVTWTNFTANPGVKVSASDVLSLRSTSSDSIVQSITLTSSSLHSVRLADSTASNAAKGAIYIDKNDDGKYDSAKDIKIGQLEVVGTGDYSTVTAADAIDGVSITAGETGSVVYSVKVKGDGTAFDKVISTKGFTFK